MRRVICVLHFAESAYVIGAAKQGTEARRKDMGLNHWYWFYLLRTCARSLRKGGRRL